MTTVPSTELPPVTRILADFVATHPARGWDEGVEREAHRTFLNWVGCAIGASRHPAVDAALAAVSELAPAAQATILGRSERVDIASAALRQRHRLAHFRLRRHPLAGRSSIRPAPSRRRRSRSPSTSVRLGGRCRCDGARASTSRAASAMRSIPITTIADGTSPARPACWAPPPPAARLLRLDAQQTAMALGIAASQPIGVREQFGSMTKPFHLGGAARAGLMSALMARHGYTASDRALEAPRGLMQTYSTKCDWCEITDGLGQRFEIAFNTYKPFACGIVIHPCIDGCIQLAHRAPARAPTTSSASSCKVHPAGARAHREDSAAHGSRGQVQRLSRLRGGHRVRQGGRGGIRRRDRDARRPGRAARRASARPPTPRIGEASADVTIVCTDGRRSCTFVAARDRQPRAADDRRRPRAEIP